jgi:hypothetical protein
VLFTVTVVLWEYPSGTVSGLEVVITGQLEVSHLLVTVGVAHWLDWVQEPKETHQPQAKPGLSRRQDEQVDREVQS